MHELINEMKEIRGSAGWDMLNDWPWSSEIGLCLGFSVGRRDKRRLMTS